MLDYGIDITTRYLDTVRVLETCHCAICDKSLLDQSPLSELSLQIAKSVQNSIYFIVFWFDFN